MITHILAVIGILALIGAVYLAWDCYRAGKEAGMFATGPGSRARGVGARMREHGTTVGLFLIWLFFAVPAACFDLTEDAIDAHPVAACVAWWAGLLALGVGAVYVIVG